MRYHNITKDDMLNGDGLRVVLWVSGCEHRCKGCHNPCTWDSNDGFEFGESELKEICEQLDKDYISGITLSGGDPLFPDNREHIQKLVWYIKQNYPNKTIWCYTGYAWDEIKHLELLKYIDVLVDGKFILEQKDTTLKWRGSSNQRVIDVQSSLNLNEVNLLCS